MQSGDLSDSAGVAIIPPRMPKLSAPSNSISLKLGENTIHNTGSASFYDAMATTTRSHAGAQVVLLNNTDRQTMIDIISGVSGTLTTVVGSMASANNDVTVFVTTGGVETEYIIYGLRNAHRPVLGGALAMTPQLVASTVGTGLLGAADNGWESTATDDIGVISPAQCIFNGIGHPFDGDLKVEIQFSAGVILGGNNARGAITYVRD